jgi:hypothetical protein
MKIMFFFTHKKKEITNSHDKKPPGFGCESKDKVISISSNNGKRTMIYQYIVFRDEWENKCCETIKKYADKNNSLILFFHTTNTPNDIKDGMERKIENYNVVTIETFTSQEEELWGKIKDIKEICQGGTIATGKEELFVELFDEIWRIPDMETKIKKAHALFLPLDIDMQTLEILAKKKENGKKVKEPKEYLEEMYADNIDYVQKLKELQAKVNTTGEIEGTDKERLKKLAGSSNKNVDQFFEKLGGKKNDPDEFLGHSWGIDGVKSFHDWYCALDSCLRGAEGCEGK